MKLETKLTKIVDNFVNTINQEKITPEQYRYISKRVREKCKLQVPTVAKKLPDFLNAAEIYNLLSVAQARNPETALIIEFLIYTGLRISECRNLLVQNIDFSNNQLKVVSGKGAKDRYVPISQSLQMKLKLYLVDRKTGYLFQKNNGRAYSIRALQIRITKIIRECSFTKQIHTHSLRHTFACLCLARGMTLEQIKLMMGHSSIKMTEIYAKLELGSVKEKYLQLMNN
jgi:integrase/recombinase XerC